MPGIGNPEGTKLPVIPKFPIIEVKATVSPIPTPLVAAPAAAAPAATAPKAMIEETDVSNTSVSKRYDLTTICKCSNAFSDFYFNLKKICKKNCYFLPK